MRWLMFVTALTLGSCQEEAPPDYHKVNAVRAMEGAFYVKDKRTDLCFALIGSHADTVFAPANVPCAAIPPGLLLQ